LSPVLHVVAWAALSFHGLVADLQSMGYDVGRPGCLSSGHMRHSKHHWGGACDLFNQTARNRTALKQPPPAVQIALAQRYGLVSGCVWRRPDCGHFEVPNQKRKGRVLADNSQKTPLVRSLNQLAQRRALDAIQELGQALPCSVIAVSGSIVTVKFEVQSTYTLPSVTVPKAESEWIRTPTQVGDKGFVVPADTYLGGVSGLGGGTAGLSLQANLSALVFLPVASKSFSASDDPNAALIYGPNGVVIRTVAKDSVLTVAVGVIRLHATSIIFDGPVQFLNQVSGTGGLIDFGNTNLTTTGTMTANSVGLTTHHHTGVTTGGGSTGGPVG
jgi:hypothetical protein